MMVGHPAVECVPVCVDDDSEEKKILKCHTKSEVKFDILKKETIKMFLR